MDVHIFPMVSLVPKFYGVENYTKKLLNKRWQQLRQQPVYMTDRSNRPEVFCKKGILGNFAKFTGKHLCKSRLRPATLLKKRFWHRCFPVKFVKFLRTLVAAFRHVYFTDIIDYYPLPFITQYN